MPTPAELKEEGLRLYRADRLAEAAEQFMAAAEGYLALGQAGDAAEMMNNLCVVRMAQKDWPAAIAAADGTPEVFRAMGDRLRQAQALANLAAACDGAGQAGQAIRLFEQAVDLFGELGEKENRAACFKALSALQVKHGQQLQALASMQSGLSLSESLSPREKTLKAMLDQAMKMIRSGK